jgi:protein-L-isoaspartate(D-aspartate) O-methyltransferase
MDGVSNPGQPDTFAVQRAIMVEQQIRRRGISDLRVLQAMERVPRHEFIPEEWKSRLRTQGYANVRVYAGDGTLGLPGNAPFDAILVAAAAPEIPAPLIEQLKEGGHLVAPVGSELQQELVVGTKKNSRLQIERAGNCRFVPLRGAHGWKKVEAG